MSAFARQRPPTCLLARRASSRSRIRNYTAGMPLGSLELERKERKRPGRSPHIVPTLIPKHRKLDDLLDLSQRKSITIRFPGADGPGVRLRYSETGGCIPFPAHSRGFLYYHSVPPAGPLEGSLRFRVTSDNAPSSFHRGQDLVAPWGLPWSITLPQIVRHTRYHKIRDQLLRENLATEAQLSHCRDIFQDVRTISPQYTLFRLDSTFLLNFAAPMWLTAVGDALHTVRLHPFRDLVLDNTDETYFPWSGMSYAAIYECVPICFLGSAAARFEPSNRAAHADRRMVHLRIVKIVEPVVSTVKGYNGRVIKPEEGQLLKVTFRGRLPEPWTYNIDRETEPALALRVLWDKSGLP
ncbi:hypothetical protein C8R44DRAFT_883801 [Mycena epipterygia]|nr:hypothetical protein C8R44DRAFT_883801 [Mycena epipterygia]